MFVRYLPAWVNSAGDPLSWQHYSYGLKHIAREQLRSSLLRAQATRMGGVVQEDWETYQRDIMLQTEVPRHVD